MINKKIFLFPLLLLLGLFNACSESPTSIGNDLLVPDYINVHKLDTYQDSVQQSSTYFQTRIKLSDSPRLFIGSYGNIDTAASLIRFGIGLADSIKTEVLNSTINVLSARVKLTRIYSIGDTTAPLIFTVHSINSGWRSAGFNADSLPSLQYDAADVSSNFSYSDTVYTFDLSTATVSSWLTAAADTSIPTDKGIFLKPASNSNRIIGFDAVNVNLTGIPSIQVVLQKPGFYTDTLTFYSIEDVSAIAGFKQVLPAGDIGVQAGLALHSRIKFDLTSIPKGSVINKALLNLYLDSSATKTGDTFTNSLIAYFVKDSSVNSYDSTSGIILNRTSNYFTGDIVKFVQSIVSGFHPNQGLIITADGQNLGVDLFALKGSEASETSLRPRLVITYTGRK